MLAIGGWNEGSSRFSPMVANSERRKELVKNTIKFLRQNHFDGLDLDWEYPSFRDGGKPRDKDNYAQLVQVRPIVASSEAQLHKKLSICRSYAKNLIENQRKLADHVFF